MDLEAQARPIPPGLPGDEAANPNVMANRESLEFFARYAAAL